MPSVHQTARHHDDSCTQLATHFAILIKLLDGVFDFALRILGNKTNGSGLKLTVGAWR